MLTRCTKEPILSELRDAAKPNIRRTRLSLQPIQAFFDKHTLCNAKTYYFLKDFIESILCVLY